MLTVGLTGNIGSGKTVVAGIFSRLGVPVFHADTEARKLYSEETVKLRVHNIFGEDVFDRAGNILRNRLAEIAFSNPDLLAELNKIIHPAVRDKYVQWCRQFVNKPYALYEAAIIFESGRYKKMDKIICVTAPEELRLQRVMDRDGLTAEEVKSRMKNQWDEARKVELADYVILNDGSESLIEQVMAIHKQLAACPERSEGSA